MRIVKITLLLTAVMLISKGVSASSYDNNERKEKKIEVVDSINIHNKTNGNLISRMLPKQTYKRVDKPNVFIPKGQWMFGATVSYNEGDSKNYNFLVLDEINSNRYNVKTEIFVGHALYNDGVVGLRGGYQRSVTDIKNISINLGEDMDFSFKDNYMISHSYSGAIFLRSYISLFNSMRFGLFNDLRIGIESGQGKTLSGVDESFTGVYSEHTRFNVGISPGIIVFINDASAFEVSIGVLGFESYWNKQTIDQIYTGTHRSSSANFKVDLFSLKFGVTFYLNSKKIENI